jgi:hypothetical protein
MLCGKKERMSNQNHTDIFELISNSPRIKQELSRELSDPFDLPGIKPMLKLQLSAPRGLVEEKSFLGSILIACR